MDGIFSFIFVISNLYILVQNLVKYLGTLEFSAQADQSFDFTRSPIGDHGGRVVCYYVLS